MKSGTNIVTKISILFMLVLLMAGVFCGDVLAQNQKTVDKVYHYPVDQIPFGNGDTVTFTVNGQIIVEAGQKLELKDCTINLSNGSDSAKWRGFRVEQSAELKLINTTIQNGTNGAVRVVGGTAIIDNCKFYNNSAEVGGAIQVEGGDLTIQGGSEFKNNTATAAKKGADMAGGAIHANRSYVLIIDGIFEGNHSIKE